MKRSEPKWKREAARQHCKDRRDKIWDALAGKNNKLRTASIWSDGYDDTWDDWNEEWDFEDEQ